MKFIHTILLLGSILGANAAALEEVPTVEMKVRADKLSADSLDARSLEDRSLELESSGLAKRACEKNGCACKKGTKQGQYCGMCSAVTKKGGQGAMYTTDIFECNSSGGCCWYGYSSTCAKAGSDPGWCPK